MPYTLEDIISMDYEDCDNNNCAYFWALQEFMPCIVGKKSWNSNYLSTHVKKFITPSDEAFMLVSLENQWDRWTNMYTSGETRKSNVSAPYTSVDTMGSTTTRQPCRKFCGWNQMGMETFNYYLEKVKESRKLRTEIEEQWKLCWNNDVDQFQANKRRKLAQLKVTPMVVRANHDLYTIEDECEDPSGAGNGMASI